MKKPPGIAKKILICILPENEREGILGDFEEIYTHLKTEKQSFNGFFWYWFQVLKFLHGFVISFFNEAVSMITNYTKTALRNMANARVNTLINIFSLAIGMACCMVVLLFIQNENSYDAFHEDNDQKYRIVYDVKNKDSVVKFARSSFPLGYALQNALPEITKSVRFRKPDPQILQFNDKRFYEDNILFSGPEFFDIFSFPLVQGDPKTALAEPNSVIITSKMAEKYFGEYDPLNQTLRLNNNLDLKVTGVINKTEIRSHLQFDFLISFDVFSRPIEERIKNWNWLGAYTYLKATQIFDKSELENKIQNQIASLLPDSQQDRFTVVLQPLKDVYREPGRNSEIGITGNPVFSYILLVSAGLVLLIACFNFVNLATALSVRRSHEVGIRKSIGAKRIQIIRQLLFESSLLSILGLVFAFVLAELFISSSASFTGGIFDNRDYAVIAPLFLCISILVGITSGVYPALFLSRFNPVEAFKGGSKSNSSGRFTRKTLVISQFSISIALIIGTLILSEQLNFIRLKELGFNKEKVIVVRLEQDSFIDRYDFMEEHLRKNVNVLEIGAASERFDGYTPSSPIITEGVDPETGFRVSTINVRSRFMDVLKFEMAEGRYFSDKYETDETLAVILNETAVRELGWESAIGKEIQSSLTNWGGDRKIIGVVKDFNFRPLYEEISPLMIYTARNAIENMYIRLGPGDIPDMIRSIEADWNSIAPDFPFEYSFLDSQLKFNYNQEEKFATAIFWTSVLAISIACFGLYGLVSYTLEKKMKEISIRKVIGATVPNILSLLTKDLFILIALSNVIAWPLAYILMSKWLENYAYRISIDPIVFIIASVSAIVIAGIIIVFKSLKAAYINPVNNLRSD